MDRPVEDRGPSLAAYNGVMIAIPTIALIVRFWARSLTENDKHGRFWWDDWTALAALPFSIATSGLVIRMTHLGVGRHITEVPQNDVVEALKTLFGGYLTYDTGLTVAKWSALFFYSRIFERRSTIFTICLWTTHVLVWAWWIGIVFATIFLCNPVEKNWIPTAPGYCGSTGALWIGSAVPSVAIDLMILLLPMPMLWGLHLKTQKKLLLLGLFACGYCVAIISLGRMITVTVMADQLNTDLTWAGVPALFWLTAETPVTILSICLPSVFFLLRRARHHGASSLFTTTISSSRAPLARFDENSDSDFSKTAPSMSQPPSVASREHVSMGNGASVDASTLENGFARDATAVVNHNSQAIHVENGFAVSHD